METIKVAAVIDCKNWAWDIKVDYLKKYINPKYEITKFYTRDDPAPNIDLFNEDYDIVLAFAWGQGTGDRGLYNRWNEVTTKKVFCKCSHFMARQASMLISPTFDAVIANNPELNEMFKIRGQKVYYCPNGVDTKLFKPQHIKHGGFLCGYVGNGDSTCEKGFSDFIEPNVPKEWLLGMDRAKGERIPHTLMPNYYNNIDMLLVMSKSEGTPNPALEAMSCAVPVVSTKVGNMMEIIENGNNGTLIDRDVESMMEAIQYYKDNPAIAKEHGKKARKVIEKDWDWSVMVKNYEHAIEDVLSQ